MIFYTLQGFGHQLEIHEDKIYLLKKTWLKLLTTKTPPESWELDELSHFEISVPKFIFSGKVTWKSFDGRSGSFRFTTNAQMMKKIETYLQKRIIKNHYRRIGKTQDKTRVRPIPAPIAA